MTIFHVSAGATSTGIGLSGGDFLYVSAGGTAIFTQVSSGGTEVVFASATASVTTVSNGGSEVVSSGGTAISTTVSAGGTGYVHSSGTTFSAAVTGADATLLVYAGGTAISTALTDGGVLDVYAGGLTSYTTLSSATENVYASGSGQYMLLSSGGIANVYADGQSNDSLLTSGGIEYVYAGGIASASTVRTQATEFLYPGASAETTVLVGGGTQIVYPDATAEFTVVRSGGILVVLPGGSVPGRFAELGNEIISTGVVLYHPHSAVTLLGASASDIAVSSGAIEYLLPGGTTTCTTVSRGGTEFVYPGASPTSTTVDLGGAIDASTLSYTGGGSTSVTTDDLLIVSVGGQTYTQQLAGTYAREHFQLAQDGGSGTLITAEPDARCFRGDTRILTERGEVAVEALRVGDRVPTVLGGTMAPIIWIGRREIDCTQHPHPRKVWPIRVAAGAFGPGQPHTDLFLSPDHSVYISDVLIPIRHLIDGATIAQVPLDRVTYYHLELACHDVLLAQGLAAETFLDLRDGSNYANRPGPTRLYPDYFARMWEAFGCAPLIVTGPRLEAARALVARHASHRQAA
jgi:autotransporter passenger strand-loop-strand repeat protein